MCKVKWTSVAVLYKAQNSNFTLLAFPFERADTVFNLLTFKLKLKSFSKKSVSLVFVLTCVPVLSKLQLPKRRRFSSG